jgi:hypothetical protein
VVVTDHGWIMLPKIPGKFDGLPKAELPISLVDVRKGRCARLKPGVFTDEQTVFWHWDKNVRVAIPRGVYCYEAGKECEHGGISPQECIVPLIRVTGTPHECP